jgi:G3E family GTPase
MSEDRDARLPISILTGFLGSGKTTLLSRLLSSPSMNATAVLINEFGEIGLDHLLVRAVHGNTVVLQNGCICCSIHEDLQRALRDLIDGKLAGPVSALDRAIIETTGVADPVPIVRTLIGDPMLCNQIRLANIITTVDSVFGTGQVDRHGPALRQAAIADRIVLTKTDIADAAGVAKLRSRLHAVNPTARLFDSQSSTLAPHTLLEQGVFDPHSRSREVSHWLASATPHGEHEQANAHSNAVDANNSDGPKLQTFSLRIEQAVDWSAFGIWLTCLLHRHGAQVLRVKGLLNIAGARGPLVLHGVQQMIHPPIHLDSWPDEDRASRLVFVVEDLDASAVQGSLFGFLGAAGEHGSARATTV